MEEVFNEDEVKCFLNKIDKPNEFNAITINGVKRCYKKGFDPDHTHPERLNTSKKRRSSDYYLSQEKLPLLCWYKIR